MFSKSAMLALPLPDALCDALETPADVAETSTLRTWLDDVCPTATGEALEAPKTALRKLHDIFKTWAGPDAAFHMFVSGSYRLGAYTLDADIDVVFVTTRSISRAAVFDGFVNALLHAPGIEDVQPVPKTRVPIIGVRIDGYEFDVLTCHLYSSDLPSRRDLLASYDWMSGLDEASTLAFSAIRVTELLIGSVPRWDQYILTLRYMRLWAKRRGIYSNKAGYLGGVNVALLVCFVARLYPAAAATTVIVKFFEVFAEWRWGAANPVRLRTAESDCPVWLSSYEWAPHAGEAMVVLTPCHPETNSTFSASAATCQVMQRELQRGAAMCAENARDVHTWAAIVTPLTVLATCTRFLRVQVSAPCTPNGRAWQGYMESQTRHLIQYLSKQELAVKEFRYIPVWATQPSSKVDTDAGTDAPTEKLHVRETYIAAEDDGKIRTYVIRGRIDVPLTYFMKMHAENGPRKPANATVTVHYIANADVLPLAFHPLSRDDLLGIAAAETAAQNALLPNACNSERAQTLNVSRPTYVRVLNVPKPFVLQKPAALKRLRLSLVPSSQPAKMLKPL